MRTPFPRVHRQGLQGKGGLRIGGLLTCRAFWRVPEFLSQWENPAPCLERSVAQQALLLATVKCQLGKVNNRENLLGYINYLAS